MSNPVTESKKNLAPLDVTRVGRPLGFPQTGPTVVFADNETCIAWSEGSIGGSERAKHLDLRVHFLREAVEAGHIVLRKIDTKLNCSDLLTKPSLSAERFAQFRQRLMGF